MPEFILKELKLGLINLLSKFVNSKNEYQTNVELCQIFLKIFVKTIGNYKNFIVHDNDNENPNDTNYEFLVKFEIWYIMLLLLDFMKMVQILSTQLLFHGLI